ncbi:MAG: glycine zipper domain-containing protein [Candidatus Methylomirabilales bacterium]
MEGISRQALALGLCVLLVAGSAVGCASLQQKVREHPGAVVGAAAGAAGGLLLGGLIFNSTAGALAGGLLGTLAGGLIGNAMEARQRDYPATAKTYNYTPKQETTIRIEKVKAQPSTVGPGDTIHLIVQYALLTPDPNREVSVTERREISTRGRLVGNPVLDVKRKAGTWASTVPLKLPSDAEAGTYNVAVAVQAEGGLDTAIIQFTVR